MRQLAFSFLLLLSLPSYAQERYYYVGPHVDVTEEGIGTYKAPPSWAVSSVDLSSDARDLMFLVADKPQEAKGYTLLGTDPNEILKQEAVTAWSKATGITVEGSDHALYGLLMDALTVHADPTRAREAQARLYPGQRLPLRTKCGMRFSPLRSIKQRWRKPWNGSTPGRSDRL